MFALVAGLRCGAQEQDPPRHREGFCAIVDCARSKPVEVKQELYAFLARALVPHIDRDTTYGVGPLAVALAAEGEWEILDFLDSDLSAPDQGRRRWYMHYALARVQDDGKVRRIMEKWALRDPRALSLARFRQGGASELVGVAEDSRVSLERRVWALVELRVCGSSAELPRLRALQDDPTEFETGYGLPGEGPKTLGWYARKSIQEIEESGR
jgi:hypothetical protein